MRIKVRIATCFVKPHHSDGPFFEARSRYVGPYDGTAT